MKNEMCELCNLVVAPGDPEKGYLATPRGDKPIHMYCWRNLSPWTQVQLATTLGITAKVA